MGLILRWSTGDSRQPRYESYDGPSRICGSVLVPCSAVRLCSGGTSGTGWRLWSAGFLELGAELSGTTCVPVATSPDSKTVRWPVIGSLVGCTEGAAVVGCTGGAAGSQLSKLMAASPASMSAPAQCCLSCVRHVPLPKRLAGVTGLPEAHGDVGQAGGGV